MLSKYKSYLFALVSVFLWASIAGVTKLLLQGLDSLQILFISTGFASLTLLLINVFSKKLHIIKQYKIKDYLKIVLTGFIGIFCYSFFLFTALFYLPAQEAFIINYLWPIMIVIFAIIILKEKLTIKKVIAMALSFIGIIIVVTKGNISSIDLSNPLGIALAISAAVCYGLFSVLVKKHKYDETVSMMLYHITGFLIAFVAVKSFSNIPDLNVFQTLGLAWLGGLTSGIGYVTWAIALKSGDTAKIANLAFITPFLSLIYIYVILGEKISIYSFVGLVIIVAGILIQSRNKEK